MVYTLESVLIFPVGWILLIGLQYAVKDCLPGLCVAKKIGQIDTDLSYYLFLYITKEVRYYFFLRLP